MLRERDPLSHWHRPSKPKLGQRDRPGGHAQAPSIELRRQSAGQDCRDRNSRQVQMSAVCSFLEQRDWVLKGALQRPERAGIPDEAQGLCRFHLRDSRLRPVPCKLFTDPPRDGIIRTSPGQECSKDKGALPGMRGILLYLHHYRWPGDNEVTQTVFSGKLGLKDEKSWSEPDLSALWCGKVWFKVVGGQL